MSARYLSFNRKLHRALRQAAPDGYEVSTVKREGTLQTVVWCDEPDYFGPWYGLQEIMEQFGY